MRKKHALVVGANGLVAKEIVNLLLDNEVYEKITLIARRYIEIDHPKVNLEVIDFRNLHKYWEIFTADDLYYCLGTTKKQAGKKENFIRIEKEYCINIAKIAFHNKVTQFLYISSKGANPNSWFLYPKTKGEIENELIQIGFLSLHLFQPSLLMGKREEFRFGESVAKFFLKIFNFMMVGFLKNFKGMPPKHLASVIVRAAMNGRSGVNIYSNRRIHEFFEKG